MSNTTIRNIDQLFHIQMKELAAKTGTSMNETILNSIYTYVKDWEHSGPAGPDRIEWWTRKNSDIGITRSINSDGVFSGYCLAYVEDGSPAGSTTDYPEYKTLIDAMEAI